MNRALWSKAIGEGRLTLLGCALVMFLFHWLFVWLVSLLPLGAFAALLQSIPEPLRKLPGMEMDSLLSQSGRIAIGYIDPVVLFVSAAWGISRGSDVVSGELGRGTMELLLAQPVRRIAILLTQAAVLAAGAAVLAVAAWCGTAAGLATVELGVEVSPADYLPLAVNLAMVTFCVGGLATLASSWDCFRWRTVGLVSGFYIVQLVMKVFARTAPKLEWLMDFTFLGAYQPQKLINADPAQIWELSLLYNGVLLGLGLAAYLGAAAIFCRRDLPAPL